MTGYDEEQQDLVALYAMNSLDDLERAKAEHLIARSPEAAEDFARYTDALGAMVDGATEVDPPTRAWDGIAAAIHRNDGADAPSSAPASVAPITAGSTRRFPPANGRWLAVAAAVLVAVIGAVAFRSVTSGTTSNRSHMTAALAMPSTRAGDLTAANGSAKVALQADGTGWVDLASLPDPGDGNVYQLWSLDSGTPVSLGVVKASGGVARFAASPGSKTLALSKEKAPGAASPTLPPVGAVTLA